MDKISNSVGKNGKSTQSDEGSSGPKNKMSASMKPAGVDKEWQLGRKFISRYKGVGLIAKEFIPSGSKIYCDELVVVSETERKQHSTPREFEALISKKVAAREPKWQEEFARIPNTREDLGPMGGIWEASHLPMSVNGEPCEMLGLNLAFTNHSCLPNSTLTVYYEYPTVNGVPQTYRKPKMGGAVVKNYFDILEGQEITVSYFYSKGELDYRRLYSLRALGFRCACAYCLFPEHLYECVLNTYYRLDNFMSDPIVIQRRPAMIFQATYQLTGELTNCGIIDPRVALIWMKCAMVAGFHSDIGRARTLLTMALTLLETVQGRSGYLYQRAYNWLRTMSLMPGFGTTLRGLSRFDDAHCLVENPENMRNLLFMAEAKMLEYVPMRCHNHPPASSSKGDDIDSTKHSVDKSDTSNVEASDYGAKEKQDEGVKKPKPKPKRRRIPKHMEKVMPKPRNKPAPKPPPKPLHKPIKKNEPKIEPNKPQGDKKKKKKRKPHSKRIHKKCNDPEHDFLILWTRIVNDFIDFGSHEKTDGDKNTGDSSTLMERETHDSDIRDFFFAKDPVLKDPTPKQKVTTCHKSGVTKRTTKKAKTGNAVAQRL